MDNQNTQTQTQDNQQQTNVNQNQQVNTDQNQQQSTQTQDIVTRVNQMAQHTTTPDQAAGDKFDFKDIEKIQDPHAREVAMNAYKSFQRGFNSKFQDLAELRKQIETGQAQSGPWTVEKVQSLLNDPTFVQSAQSVAQAQQSGKLTNEEYSALTDSEKKQFNQMQNQLQMISQQNTALIQQQQDERLKSKYASYDPKIVNTMTQELMSGRYQATREDIWKVVNYEDAVKRAYELGQQDRKLDINQRVESNATVGLNVTNSDNVPAREKGESAVNYFRRLAQRRLAESRNQQNQRR